MKKFYLILLLIVSSCATGVVENGKYKSWMEDRLYTEKGEELKGRILEITSDSVFISTSEGKIVLPRSEVSSIDIASKREGYLWNEVEDISDTLLKKNLTADLEKYREEGFVNLYVEKELIIEEDSTYRYSSRIIRGISSEKGRNAGTVTFSYRNNSERMNIEYARTVTSDGEVLHLRENAIEDASIFSRIPPYENLHEKKIAMREVKPGNILDFKITKTGRISESNPYIMDVLIGSSAPTIKAVIRVSTPREFELSWQDFRIEKPGIKIGDGEKVLIWEIDTLTAVEREENRPPLPSIMPRVVVGLKNSWKNIAGRFRNYLDGEYVTEHTRDVDIYREVITSIKYVDVPSYTYSPYPKDPKTILNSKIANSLDKASLMFQALKSGGYPVQLILVRSKERGEVAVKVPSLNQFDGALLKLGNKYLDPASELMPFGYIRPEYQGTEGLSIMRKEIVDVPLLEPEQEKTEIKRDVYVKKDGSADIEEEITFSGNQVTSLKMLKYYRDEQKKNILESYVNQNVQGAELTYYEFSNLNSFKNELGINLRYKSPNMGLNLGDYLLLKLPGINYSASSVGAEKRNYPLYRENLSKEAHKIRLNLPEGYSVRYLPENVEISSDFLDFNCEFKKMDNRIIYMDYLIGKEDIIPVEKYSEYQKYIMKIATIPEEWIILEKK